MQQTEPVFDFSVYPELFTERLHLRAPQMDDADALAALHRAPDVMRFLAHEPADTLEKAQGLIGWFEEMYKQQKMIQWVMELKATGEVIGMCGVNNWSREDRRVDIGYMLHPDYWNQGYTTEAARAMTRWSFEQLNVHRVQADCTEGNEGSARVLLKCGFKHEGTWRENTWEHGRFVSLQQFGVLRREFLGEE
jgi:[ribosomal protein S5]-alanine N-acetyltransferase